MRVASFHVWFCCGDADMSDGSKYNQLERLLATPPIFQHALIISHAPFNLTFHVIRLYIFIFAVVIGDIHK